MRSTLIQEELRPINNYEGLFDVSNFGRISPLKFGKIKILKFGKTKDGYLKLSLWKDGKKKWFYVSERESKLCLLHPKTFKSGITTDISGT